jgi:feruloyl esterase
MARKFLFLLAIAAFAAAGIRQVQAQSLQSELACAALARFSIPGATITSAGQVASSAVTIPNPSAPESSTPQSPNLVLPTFCRVAITLTPTSDSAIEMEVWLPASGWNGKFHGVGNGGFAGVIDYDNMASSLYTGYATAGSDGGHETSELTDASWALGHPQKIIDFGYRATHLMTQTAKAIIEDYYGIAPTYSYFASCSDGGREALMEAQNYPTDYNGIIAGDPAYNWSGLLTNAINNSIALAAVGGYISSAKIPAIAAAVVAACDKLDGVADGILNDPRKCTFEPSSMLCKGAETNSCLTSAEVATMKTLYAGSTNTSGAQIFPGYMPGGETGTNGWQTWITGTSPGTSEMYLFGDGYFSDMVYNNPNWAYDSFDATVNYEASLASSGQAIDATNPDISPFVDNGGKLIIYHGWSDAAVSPLSSIDYFGKVQAAIGSSKTNSSVRLYMVPGMQHCFQGVGPDNFGQNGWSPSDPATDTEHNMYLALENWVETGGAPGTLIATQYSVNGATQTVTMTRPICPYPQAAKYKGSGNINVYNSFTCSAE